MSASYYAYTFIGIDMNKYISVQDESRGFYKHDSKTGEKTDEYVTEEIVFYLNFGNKYTHYTVKGKGKHSLDEELIGELIKFENTGMESFTDYVDDYWVGFSLFESKDLNYSEKQWGGVDMSTLNQLEQDLINKFKDEYDIEVEPKLMTLTYVSV